MILSELDLAHILLRERESNSRVPIIVASNGRAEKTTELIRNIGYQAVGTISPDLYHNDLLADEIDFSRIEVAAPSFLAAFAIRNARLKTAKGILATLEKCPSSLSLGYLMIGRDTIQAVANTVDNLDYPTRARMQERPRNMAEAKRAVLETSQADFGILFTVMSLMVVATSQFNPQHLPALAYALKEHTANEGQYQQIFLLNYPTGQTLEFPGFTCWESTLLNYVIFKFKKSSNFKPEAADIPGGLNFSDDIVQENMECLVDGDARVVYQLTPVFYSNFQSHDSVAWLQGQGVFMPYQDLDIVQKADFQTVRFGGITDGLAEALFHANDWLKKRD